jgi:hypothetical protein
MKAFVALAIASLTTFGTVSSAAAFSFSPPDTHFKLRGALTITDPHTQCNATRILWLATKSPKIDAAFSDCRYTPTGLPWQVRATGLNRATIVGFAFVPDPGVDQIGPCGPGNLFAKVSSTGVWTFKNSPLPGGCTINGSLTSDPPVTVVP